MTVAAASRTGWSSTTPMLWSGSRFSISRQRRPCTRAPPRSSQRGILWWFFLIQPAPLPERLIGADPEFFLRTHIEGQSKTPGSTSEALFQEYLRCYLDPATRHAICADYRAAATIDLDHDAVDVDRRITAPLLALWGAKGTVGQLYDVLETWREKALDVRGRALDCGHTLQEEAPQETLRELLGFLA